MQGTCVGVKGTTLSPKAVLIHHHLEPVQLPGSEGVNESRHAHVLELASK